MQQSVNRSRTKWVDVLKGLAILAVITDHVNGILYTNPNVAYFSYYSVSVFIIVMGITTYWSFLKNKENILDKIKQKCIKIFIPYMVATIVYTIATYRIFDFEVFVNHLIHFNASGPLYYVLLYIQLVIVSPILYRVIDTSEEKGAWVKICGLICILFISSITTNYTNILSAYGGGGKLFGGTYLFLLYWGMLFGKYSRKNYINHRKLIVTICGISCIITFLWYKFLAINKLHIDKSFPYGGGFNPPSVSLTIYAILIVTSVYLFEKVINNVWIAREGKLAIILNKIYNYLAGLGRHTLYIFLYHRFFLDFVIPWSGMVIDNIWIKRIVYFTLMIAGSVLIEKIMKKGRSLVFMIS